MTTRKEIGEGMDKLIYARIMSFLTEDEWKDVAPDYHPKTALCERLTGEILSYLHSQGVVIKVERELPDYLMEGQVACDKQTYAEILKRAGYVAVEPLIKEDEMNNIEGVKRGSKKVKMCPHCKTNNEQPDYLAPPIFCVYCGKKLCSGGTMIALSH